MAEVTLAGLDGSDEAPPPFCMCCPTEPAPQLGRLDRTVQQFLSTSGVPGQGRTAHGAPVCIDPNARAPVVYANTVAGAASLKDGAAEAIEEFADELEHISSEIWHNPEMNFEEEFCHKLLCDFLEAMDGVTVTRSYLELPTALRATAGSGHPVVAVCAEYDALPGIGHACGHNLISESALAAFIGAKRAIDAGAPGTVVLLGTPAEEGGGGKIAMISRGCFDDIDLAMMAHPSPTDCLYPPFLCTTMVHVSYHGRNAHAAAAPWEGVNALDAVLQAFSNISMMRQQMKPSWRVHGVITEGGKKANIIPDLTETNWIIRTPDMVDMADLRARVEGCFEAAGTATGCECAIEWNKIDGVDPDTVPAGHALTSYTDVATNSLLAEAMRANMVSHTAQAPHTFTRLRRYCRHSCCCARAFAPVSVTSRRVTHT